ncbi:MAG: selenium cofactor biosynthesis protein YqeC [Wenzhouxiangellaceae bacterium]|nr:selenium cofactor biosynthesis protein YqeC [Wenzhouxiangellaceae bacterium]
MSDDLDDGMNNLRAALGVERGIVAAVGAGGKKSLLCALADGDTGRLAWTTTVHSTRPPRWTGIEMHYDAEPALLDKARKLSGTSPARYGFLGQTVKSGRRPGLSPEAVGRLHRDGRFDLTLVKADGARMRGIKAPKPGEPVLPPSSDLILYLVSAGVIGRPLDDTTAHRPELLEAITGIEQGALLTPESVARLLSSVDGALSGLDACRNACRNTCPLVPVINQVDDAGRLELATAAARMALERSDRFDRVVLTCLNRRKPGLGPVVAVIRR